MRKMMMCMEIEVLGFKYESMDEYTEHYEEMIKKGYQQQYHETTPVEDNMEVLYYKPL